MTKKEALQILAVLKAAYPASYNNMTKEEASGTVSVWAMQFDDMPVEIVMMAIHKAIATSKYPPTVAEVKEKIKAIHWESYDIAHGGLRDSVPENVRNQYLKIYGATEAYRHGYVYEPKIGQMLTNGQQLQIGDRST